MHNQVAGSIKKSLYDNALRRKELGMSQSIVNDNMRWYDVQFLKDIRSLDLWWTQTEHLGALLERAQLYTIFSSSRNAI